jgi:hypothetical protein
MPGPLYTSLSPTALFNLAVHHTEQETPQTFSLIFLKFEITDSLVWLGRVQKKKKKKGSHSGSAPSLRHDLVELRELAHSAT